MRDLTVAATIAKSFHPSFRAVVHTVHVLTRTVIVVIMMSGVAVTIAMGPVFVGVMAAKGGRRGSWMPVPSPLASAMLSMCLKKGLWGTVARWLW